MGGINIAAAAAAWIFSNLRLMMLVLIIASLNKDTVRKDFTKKAERLYKSDTYLTFSYILAVKLVRAK